jgi:hypothetical protein
MYDRKNRECHEALCCLTYDIESMFGVDLSRDRLLLATVFDASGIKKYLQVLHQHRLVLDYYLKYDILPRTMVEYHALVPGIKRIKKEGRVIPALFSSLWAMLESQDSCLHGVIALRQLLLLLSKLEMQDIDPAPTIEGFLGRTSSAQHSEDPGYSYFMYDIERYIGSWLKGISPETPYTSSGATLDHTPVLDRVGYYAASMHRSFKERFLKGTSFEERACADENRLVSVPKDWRRVRIVCVEPYERMNWQQSIRLMIEGAASTTIANRVSFKSQDFQRSSLALDGRSSIDLSDASDWVPWPVIFRAFSRVPEIRAALQASRSRFVTLNGSRYTLKCYATMGNATTFTVMTVLLAALCAAVEDHVYRYSGFVARPSTVFGDDIVCDDAIAGSLLMGLRLLGLKPNDQKTYISKRFKESCGLDLFEGVDVTPLRCKTIESARCHDDILRYIAYSNHAHELGYWKLAEYLGSLTGTVIPCNMGEGSFRSFSSGVHYRGASWNTNYQCFETFKARAEERIQLDSQSHLEYCLAHPSKEGVSGRVTSTKNASRKLRVFEGV